MTIIDLTSRPAAAKPQRTTLANPVLLPVSAEQPIAAIDEDLDLLYCIAATLAGTEGVPDEAVNGLRTLHARMRSNIETLYTMG
jgi:hypothetical protein